MGLVNLVFLISHIPLNLTPVLMCVGVQLNTVRSLQAPTFWNHLQRAKRPTSSRDWHTTLALFGDLARVHQRECLQFPRLFNYNYQRGPLPAGWHWAHVLDKSAKHVACFAGREDNTGQCLTRIWTGSHCHRLSTLEHVTYVYTQTHSRCASAILLHLIL